MDLVNVTILTNKTLYLLETNHLCGISYLLSGPELGLVEAISLAESFD